jgi:hypothetical protein
MSESFFEARGDGVFAATELTRGPWDARLMHGGPPAALLGREIERLAGADMHVARITVEFLRPLAIGELVLRADTTRPGRKVRTFAGSLSQDGKELVRASALAIRRLDMDLGIVPGPEPARFAAPDTVAPWQFPFFRDTVGYHTAMEVRVVRGALGEGAMTAWMRMRVPLLVSEAPSGLQRTLCAADSGNGLSVALNLARFTFLNPDLTVCLTRPPRGAWVGLDAVTRAEPHGTGLAESAIFDEGGPIGRAAQTLIVEPR